MFEGKLVICPQSESLECFLIRSKGRKCVHCLPHKYYNITCSQEKCATVDGHVILHCICVPFKEENNNGKQNVDL